MQENFVKTRRKRRVGLAYMSESKPGDLRMHVRRAVHDALSPMTARRPAYPLTPWLSKTWHRFVASDPHFTTREFTELGYGVGIGVRQ